MAKTTTAELLNVMEAHIKEDRENFHELQSQILEVNKDVKSLLQTRAFGRGVWYAATVGGGVVGAVISLAATWYRYAFH